MHQAPPTPPTTPKGQMRALLFGGLLPIIAFTVIEEKYGTLWGLVAGMVFGVGEILNEWRVQKRVDTITWIGNGLLIGTGLVSLLTSDGIWFKLQPSILELLMGGFLIGSVLWKKPFLLLMMEKQGSLNQIPESLQPSIKKAFAGVTVRLGIFVLFHAALAAYAAFYWSTLAWATLKGVGFMGSMFVYMLIEMIFIRMKIKKSKVEAR